MPDRLTHRQTMIRKEIRIMADKEYGFEETMVTLTDEDGLEKDFYVDEMDVSMRQSFRPMLRM